MRGHDDLQVEVPLLLGMRYRWSDSHGLVVLSVRDTGLLQLDMESVPEAEVAHGVVESEDEVIGKRLMLSDSLQEGRPPRLVRVDVAMSVVS